MPLVAPNKPARNGSIRHAGATPPRVLLVCANRLNFNGGAKVETVQLVRALADAGSAVGLLVDDGSPDLHPAVQRFTLSFAPKRNATIRKEIRHALEVFKPDVVHVIGAGVRTARAVEAVCSRGPGAPPVPWAITLHNLCPREYDVPWCVGRNRRWRALRNLRYAPVTTLWGGVLRRAGYAAAICHSQHVVDLARGRGVPADRMSFKWGLVFIGGPLVYYGADLLSGRPLMRILMMKMHISSPTAWYYRWKLRERVLDEMPGHWWWGHGLDIPAAFAGPFGWSIDNSYLSILFYTGIIGVAGWVALQFAALFCGLKSVWLTDRGRGPLLARHLGFAVVALMLSQYSVAMFSTGNLLLWLTLGLAAGLALTLDLNPPPPPRTNAAHPAAPEPPEHAP